MGRLNISHQEEKYRHIISLGWFCSVSSELERIGLRDCSGPFDWLLTSWSGVEECIKNNFKDLLNVMYMRQYNNEYGNYVNTKLDFHYYHDFDKYITYENQIAEIINKYKRRIDRFYQNIKEPTLFVRYIRDYQEAQYLDDNIIRLTELIKKYNPNNDIIFVSNRDIITSKVRCYHVDKDENDTVCRRFLDNNDELFNYLNSGLYDNHLQRINIKKYEEKMKLKEKNKTKLKIENKLKKVFLTPKIYRNQYDPKLNSFE